MSFQQAVMKATKQTEFYVRRNGPTILTTVGVAGFVATTAFTIRATAKAIDAMPALSKRVHEARDKAVAEDLNAKAASEELARAYLRNGVELAKIYGPTFTIGSASIVCILAGHGMMLKRQTQLVALYTALDASFKTYRARVAEKIGAEEERELYKRPNMRALDQLDGEEGEPIYDVNVNGPLPSPYARFFDESSPNWRKTPEYNLMFLRAEQDWANNKLKANGHLFLNEVYDALGLERSQAGQLVGWMEGAEGGDGFVDFGLYAQGDEGNRAFVNILEPTVLLDFNVDGVIRI
jgi:hypothetical protein